MNLTCTRCKDPMHPAATRGGHTTHPCCDPGADALMRAEQEKRSQQ